MRLLRRVRPAITQSRNAQWGFVSSTARRLPPCTRAPEALPASPLLISMYITAMALKQRSGMMKMRFSHRPMNGRNIRARVVKLIAAHLKIFATRRSRQETGREEFRRAWGETLLPALSDFDPDFVVVSAGFDAHAADPLGGLQLTEEDFAWATAEILAIAKDKAEGRLISLMEGGYDLPALASSAAAHVRVLMD